MDAGKADRAPGDRPKFGIRVSVKEAHGVQGERKGIVTRFRLTVPFSARYPGRRTSVFRRQKRGHPHIHGLVTGGGVSADGGHWHPARQSFLVPEIALAKLVRGKLKALLANKRPDLVVPLVWTKPWVVKITPWGEGQDAVLQYLARYVFRIAITNSRILALDDRTVTFRYKHRQSSRWRTCRIDGLEFIRRFLQHVLPKGLHKVRYFGLWHPSKRLTASNVRLLLYLERTQPPPAHPGSNLNNPKDDNQRLKPVEPRICPRCRQGHLVFFHRLTPKQAQAP
jgi:hypothetical protein